MKKRAVVAIVVSVGPRVDADLSEVTSCPNFALQRSGPQVKGRSYRSCDGCRQCDGDSSCWASFIARCWLWRKPMCRNGLRVVARRQGTRPAIGWPGPAVSCGQDPEGADLGGEGADSMKRLMMSAVAVAALVLGGLLTNSAEAHGRGYYNYG